MNFNVLIIILSIGFNACFMYVSGQDMRAPLSIHNNNDSANIPGINDIPDRYTSLLTMVYDIKVTTDKNKAGIEETYNGGIKTIFVNNENARIRMVSLMRIQSIFFSSSNSSHPVSIVKESGKKKYKYYFTSTDWDLYNSKYEGDSCQFTNDSATILNYPCRKAIIALKDGRQLIIYYTDQLKPLNRKIEPAFNCIPGLVLQYQYQYKKGTIIYTASKISLQNISPNVFRVPAGRYTIKKYCSKCRVKGKVASEDSAIE